MFIITTTSNYNNINKLDILAKYHHVLDYYAE